MAMLFDSRLELRITTSEKRRLERRAATLGMNASQYLRFLIQQNSPTLTESQ